MADERRKYVNLKVEKGLKDAGVGDPEPMSSAASGVDKGDIPGPNADFFKARDHSKDKEGLVKALKKRGY